MARPIVKAVTGITLSKRFVFDQVSISDSTANYDTATKIDLVETVETMDEEVESDGSVVADVPLYSRITAMRGQFLLAAAAATQIRWMLCKLPDGEDLIGSGGVGLQNAAFHGSNDNPNSRELRKYTLAKGQVMVSADRLAAGLRVRVSKAAWARCSPMREGDKIALYFAKDTAGTTANISGFGTLWVRANG